MCAFTLNSRIRLLNINEKRKIRFFFSLFFFFLSARLILDLCQFHTTTEPVMIFRSASDTKDRVWFEINITDFRYQLAGIYLCAAWVWPVEMKTSVPEHKFPVSLEMMQAVLAGLQLLFWKSRSPIDPVSYLPSPYGCGWCRQAFQLSADTCQGR